LLDYLIVGLFVLNIIAVLFLVGKNSFRNDFDNQQVSHQKMSDNNQKIVLEITELKRTWSVVIHYFNTRSNSGERKGKHLKQPINLPPNQAINKIYF
jgi:hypothetical protein